ncbi:MAG: hypothetical protein RIS35_2389 [Pseudomonadota bacterium]|jgi:hypothetical protein
MRARNLGLGIALVAVAVPALAAGPVRTPGTYTTKNFTGDNPNRVTSISLDNTYAWDADSSVRTTFNNNPDAQGRGNPAMTFLHLNNGLSSRLDFASTMGANGSSATATFRRVGSSGPTTQTQSAGPNGNGTTNLNLNFVDNAITANLIFWSARSGYADVLRSGGYYGAGGFFAVPDEYRTGSFSGGLTTFRFESNQDVGTARMLYNFANDGGENGTVRARLLYLDRNGDDGYNKIRFTYVSNPVSRN